MSARAKGFSTIHINIDTDNLHFHLDLPSKWITIVVVALLIYFSPDIWNALDSAISAIR